MITQSIRDANLDEKLRDLFRKLLTTTAQAKIRKEIVSIGELELMAQRIFHDCGDADDDVDEQTRFARAFDFNGFTNLVTLAEIRGVGQRRLILDLALECNHLQEADYSRYRRQLDSNDRPRRSILFHYLRGVLFINGESIGTIQERSTPTRMQTVLQMFQDQGWPLNIDAPVGWDDEKVGNVCRELRNRFEPAVTFCEQEGGRSIRWQLPGGEVTPN